MNNFASQIKRTIPLSVIVLLLFSGCKKEEDKTAPSLPPSSAFAIDFSDFSNPADTTGSREGLTYHNWGYSYVNVVTWNVLLTVGLAVPVAAFNESFNHEAVYHPDAENWTWSYIVSSGGSTYEAELTGYIVSDSVSWEMRITRNNIFSDFLWYYGKSALDQSGGYWILMNNPQNPTSLLKIDWQKNFDNSADIRYTNIVPSAAENGSYIFYGITNFDLNRFYVIFNKQLNNLTAIEWNSENRSGHVKDQNHFGDDLWHCWDTNLLDVVCP